MQCDESNSSMLEQGNEPAYKINVDNTTDLVTIHNLDYTTVIIICSLSNTALNKFMSPYIESGNNKN
jgi:hypothetical protein